VRLVGDVVMTLRENAFRASIGMISPSTLNTPLVGFVSEDHIRSQDLGQTVVLVTDLFSQVIQALILGSFW